MRTYESNLEWLRETVLAEMMVMLEDACRQDGLVPAEQERVKLREGMERAVHKLPFTEDFAATMRAWSAEQLRAQLRKDLWPMLMQSLAPLRPS